MKNKVVVAKILSTKGLKGEVKLKSFMLDVDSLLDYELYDNKNNLYKLEYISNHSSGVVAKFIGINDIDEAKKLNSIELNIDRDLLPLLDKKEDDFYYVDLEGIEVRDANQIKIGKVISVHNFGAGDILEIKKDDNKQTTMVYFNKNFVPEVNIKDGYIVISVSEIYDKDLTN